MNEKSLSFYINSSLIVIVMIIKQFVEEKNPIVYRLQYRRVLRQFANFIDYMT